MTRKRTFTKAGRLRTALAGVATLAVAAGVTIAVDGQQSPAEAANQYTVTANSTKPGACKNYGTIPAGGWVANKPCGYVMGTAMAGTRFDVNANSGNNFHYGRTRSASGENFCTWLIPGALNLGSRTTVADSCSAATRDRMVHRRSFGVDFDAAPHTGNGAIVVPVNASACQGYYNYFDDSFFDSGRLRDPVGFALPAEGGYRYSSKDRQASMIRVKDSSGETIWMFVARSCIESQLPANLNNQDD